MSKIPTCAAVATVLALGLGAYATNVTAQGPPPIPISLEGPEPIASCQIINVSGSYVLVNNLPDSLGLLSGGDCIIVNADLVAINMNGFSIQGHGMSGEGVTDNGVANFATTLRNGTIIGFQNGVNLSQTAGARIERVQVTDNGSRGIDIGQDGFLQYNIATDNDVGIQAQCPSNAIGNSAWSNGTHNFNFIDPGLCIIADARHNAFDFGTCGALNEPCQVGIGACQSAGVTVCTSDLSATQCSATPGTPSFEICNGFDDDCNGVTDETFGDLNNICFAGIGFCQRVGIQICTGDGSGTECSVEQGPAATEICNGVDDDCDGSVDEGGVCG